MKKFSFLTVTRRELRDIKSTQSSLRKVSLYIWCREMGNSVRTQNEY